MSASAVIAAAAGCSIDGGSELGEACNGGLVCADDLVCDQSVCLLPDDASTW